MEKKPTISPRSLFVYGRFLQNKGADRLRYHIYIYSISFKEDVRFFITLHRPPGNGSSKGDIDRTRRDYTPSPLQMGVRNRTSFDRRLLTAPRGGGIELVFHYTSDETTTATDVTGDPIILIPHIRNMLLSETFLSSSIKTNNRTLCFICARECTYRRPRAVTAESETGHDEKVRSV